MFLKTVCFIVLAFLLNSLKAFSSENKKGSPLDKCREAVSSLDESKKGTNIENPTKELLPVLALPIKNLDLSAHAYNILKESGIKHIWDLAQRTEKQLLDIPNFGKKSLGQVKAELSKRDLSLGMALDGIPKPKNLETPEKELSFKEESAPEVPPTVELHPILALPIQSLNFSIPSHVDLESNNINYVGDLIQKTEEELLNELNFGQTNLSEMKALLSKRGVQFGMVLDKWPLKPELLARVEAVARTVHSRVLYFPVLTSIEKKILKLRFGIDEASSYTYEETGQALNLSEDKIKDMEEESLRKLYRFARYSLGRENITSPFSIKQEQMEQLLKILEEKKKQAPHYLTP